MPTETVRTSRISAGRRICSRVSVARVIL
jgi:hypothetical protein